MILRAGVLALSLLLASRLLGLLRESAQAAAFGASALGDLAVLMLTLPDLVVGLIAGGAFTYVLLPYWAGQEPQERAWSIGQLQRWVTLIGGTLAVLLWLFDDQVVRWLASGLPLESRAAAAAAIGWSAIALPAAWLAALWVTALQNEQDFVGMYAANLVVNAILVMGLWWIARDLDALSAVRQLGLWLIVAMFGRLGWLRWRLSLTHPQRRSRLFIRRDASVAVRSESIRPLPPMADWWWAMLASGLPLALPLFARSIASTGGEGGLATFSYAWKLVELPLILAIQLVASLSFPAIARAISAGTGRRTAAHGGRLDKPRKEDGQWNGDVGVVVRGAFMLAWTLACASAAALLVGAPAIAQILFGWGRMSPAGMAQIAQWGAVASWCLLPQALTAVAMTILASQGRIKSAIWAYVGALLAMALMGAAHGAGDGVALMWTLDGLYAGIAVVTLMLVHIGLPRGALFWLPWRAMCIPTITLMVVVGLSRLTGIAGMKLTTTLGIVMSAVTAIVVIAVTWACSAQLRVAVRR